MDIKKNIYNKIKIKLTKRGEWRWHKGRKDWTVRLKRKAGERAKL